MKIKDVPQDHSETLKGHGTKLMYAVDDTGAYITVQSNGWDVEELVLRDVVDDFKSKAEEAKIRALNNQISPIEYFMYKNLMDLSALSYGVGFSQWRIKRHLKPSIFKKLNENILKRYAEFFKIDINMLKYFKENV